MAEKPTSTQTPRRTDAKALARFMQELSWLLTSYSHLDFKALEGLAKAATAEPVKRTPARRSAKTDVKTLVGILPGLFVDEALFPTNEDISEFALSALSISIPRWQKKSRYELIGHIVCTANTLQGAKLSSLVAALSKEAGDGAAKTKIEDQRQRGLSWNEVIQNLLQDAS